LDWRKIPRKSETEIQWSIKTDALENLGCGMVNAVCIDCKTFHPLDWCSFLLFNIRPISSIGAVNTNFDTLLLKDPGQWWVPIFFGEWAVTWPARHAMLCGSFCQDNLTKNEDN
jgi:hypothetical protein